MQFSKPVLELIKQRHSCRTYEKRFLNPEAVDRINTFIKGVRPGPFGGSGRYVLAAASEGDAEALKGLGTYGVIRNPAAFIIGAVRGEDRTMADFGRQMQYFALHLEDMGLGSCWLGGSLNKSRFAAKIRCAEGETVPAVLSVGYPNDRRSVLEKLMRFGAGSDKRKSWKELFFSERFGAELDVVDAGRYAAVLEAVRLAPSASNKQPWRIIRDNKKKAYHLYLARTPGYAERAKRGGIADLQLADMGIAMCHFEAAAAAEGLSGAWESLNPNTPGAPAEAEFITTWTFNGK